jgi:hypothetical protein
MRGALLLFASLAACAHSTSASIAAKPGLPPEQRPRSAATAKYLEHVKAGIAKVWVPAVEEAACRNDPEGSRWSTVDRSTTISYFLDPDGTIVETKLVQASGADYLDAVALRTPLRLHFERPPVGLIEGSSRADGAGEFSFRMTVLRAPEETDQTSNACSAH